MFRYRNMMSIFLVVGILISGSSCSIQHPKEFSESPVISEAKAKLPQEINYSNYLKIDCHPIEVLTENYSQLGSMSFDQVRYCIRVENITQKPIELRFRVFLDNEFTKSFTESASSTFCSGPSESFNLDVGKGFTIDIVEGIISDSSLDGTQMHMKQSKMGVYDFEFLINGKWSFIRYDSKTNSE